MALGLAVAELRHWRGTLWCNVKNDEKRAKGASFQHRHTLRDNGEPAGVRTLDLLIKSQLLYQLSYRLSPSRFSMFYQHIEVSASQHRS